MSANLYWQPVVKVKQHALSDKLRYAIARRYWGHDGSLHGAPIRLTESDLTYLSGVRDAGVEDAGELIEAIERFGEVEISIEQ